MIFKAQCNFIFVLRFVPRNAGTSHIRPRHTRALEIILLQLGCVRHMHEFKSMKKMLGLRSEPHRMACEESVRTSPCCWSWLKDAALKGWAYRWSYRLSFLHRDLDAERSTSHLKQSMHFANVRYRAFCEVIKTVGVLQHMQACTTSYGSLKSCSWKLLRTVDISVSEAIFCSEVLWSTGKQYCIWRLYATNTIKQ